jgi:hypothetical protein
MDKKFKELYSFTLEKTIKTKEKSINTIDGKEVEIFTPTEKKVPIKFIIKSPSRSIREDADTFYAITFNKFLSMGLLTRAMIGKRYSDIGGILSDDEQKDYLSKRREYYEATNDLIRLETLGDDISITQKERKDSLILKVSEIKQEMFNFEIQKEDLFRQTADYKARDQLILWWILHLTYTKDETDEESKPIPYFEGKDFDEKKEFYEDKEDSGDEIFMKALVNLSFFIQFWVMQLVHDAESFEKIKKDIEEEDKLNGKI